MREIGDLPLEKAFDKFINIKKAVGRVDDTIRYYQERFAWFCDFLKEHKNITTTSEVNEDCVIDYTVYLKGKGTINSNHSINNYLRAVRAVLYYFMEKGYTEPFHISLVSAKKKPKDPYSQADQLKLIKKPDIKKCAFPLYRNWVMICHWLASGIRLNTIIFIRNRHINLNEKIIALDEVKGNDGYEMPISDEYLPILKEYMEIRGGDPDDFLFCNQFGKQLTSSGLKSIMYKHNKKLDIDITSIHRYRHTFAKNWLLTGGSKEKLQHALGHKSSHMVDEYARLYGRELREDFSKFTPLAKLKGEVTENKRLSMKKAIS